MRGRGAREGAAGSVRGRGDGALPLPLRDAASPGSAELRKLSLSNGSVNFNPFSVTSD